MASNPPFLLFVCILLFLYLSPDPPTPGESLKFDHVIQQEYADLETLVNSTFGDLTRPEDEAKGLNLTGLKKEHGLHWDLLAPARDQARQQARRVLGEEADKLVEGAGGETPLLYHNISGFVEGNWARTRSYGGPPVNLSAIVGHNTYASDEWSLNLSATAGDIRIHFNEKEERDSTWNKTIQELSAKLVIGEDTAYGKWWEFRLHGYHLIDTGGIVLTTTSEKFAGIFALPHFALSNHAFHFSKELLNRSLNDTIRRQKETGEVIYPWSSDAEGRDLLSVPHCEYVVYLQQHPVELDGAFGRTRAENAAVLKTVEEELRFPNAPFAPSAPSMVFSMVAFSPDCGFIIESKGPPDYFPAEGTHLKGPKAEVYVKIARRHILIFTATMAAQLLLLLRQMKDASTPSTRSRISFYTIAIMAMGDGFTLVAFSLFGTQVESTTLPLLGTAYLAFLSLIFFGMGFLKEIWTVQATERNREQRQNATTSNINNQPQAQTATQAADNTTPSSAPVITAAGADTLPRPVTARQAVSSGATPIIIPSDQDISAELAENTPNDNPPNNTTAGNTSLSRYGFGAVYVRFYLLLFGLVFLSINASSWPVLPRSIYAQILTGAYFSFFVPQIYRNVMRNCRRALRWDYVVGQSLLRLLPFAYFYLVRGNILLVTPGTRAFLALATWVWLQLVVLLGQEYLGPRFFVSSAWVPAAYDYHPVLRADEEGAALPSGGKILAGDETAPASPVLSTSVTRKAGESRDKGVKVFDCAICMQALEVPVIPAAGADEGDGGAGGGSAAGTGIGGGVLLRRGYMVTPCRHIFHSTCLEGWMRYRLQCPICREVLPPL
ncbi:hypothetical protein K490DRAFT_73852 [Saccharata proteae CBS 121410]|uniref:DSC E3 ubiquitin ligase complex subunit A n=1 Tax=Saccharata proteae CBS 121410 TaxID=1314787 RepID=A0A9P4LYV8_9PEZI|nr:hypothetical protein K490DRAFT_73852 [Saccharata proteae CBS 121410]